MIKIDNKTNIQTLEKAYTELSKNNSSDIMISKGLLAADFGLVPAIIQFFATWFNQTIKSKIIFDIKSESELPEFYEADYIFPSIVYCWNREIIDKNGKDLKPLLKAQNQVKVL